MKRQPRDPYRDNLVNRRSELYKNNQTSSHTILNGSIDDEMLMMSFHGTCW